MEFNEKLQELRRHKGLTQEELAGALFVSRTAVSKWESGRGYPNIDSLKALSKFFSVTIDELLSVDEVLTIAEEDHRQKQQSLHDVVYALFDLSTTAFLFLPLFGQKASDQINAVSLLSLEGIATYLKVSYWFITIAMIMSGVLTLALQHYRPALWERIKTGVSLTFNILGTLLFIISGQPYAATFLFIFLLIKLLMSGKKG